MGLYGLEIPPSVQVGADVLFEHHGFGTVIHPHTQIGDRVQIFHGVTVGDAVPWPQTPGTVGDAIIGDDVTLGAGAKILVPRDTTLTIGQGAVIGANSVVLQSVPAWEVWAGNPARRVGQREKTQVRPGS